MSPALEHFLKLAFRGQHRACSGGEYRAAKLAKTLLANVPGLDSQAVQGLGEFAVLCSEQPHRVAELLRPRRKAGAA